MFLWIVFHLEETVVVEHLLQVLLGGNVGRWDFSAYFFHFLTEPHELGLAVFVSGVEDVFDGAGLLCCQFSCARHQGVVVVEQVVEGVEIHFRLLVGTVVNDHRSSCHVAQTLRTFGDGYQYGSNPQACQKVDWCQKIA